MYTLPNSTTHSSHPQLFNDALGTTNVEWDPYMDDVHFVLSTFALEEIGATGDKGVTGLVAMNGNGTVVDLVGGLAQSAGYQAAADRYILWTHRNDTLPEFGKTVNEVMEELTSYRQALTGDVQIDQGLTYNGGINVVPTDGNGVTLSRTPQQVGRGSGEGMWGLGGGGGYLCWWYWSLGSADCAHTLGCKLSPPSLPLFLSIRSCQVLHILTLGSSNGMGGFFPDVSRLGRAHVVALRWVDFGPLARMLSWSSVQGCNTYPCITLVILI